MKFVSPFTIGDAVARHSNNLDSGANERPLEILEVAFDASGKTLFLCEEPSSLNRQYYTDQQIDVVGGKFSPDVPEHHFESEFGLGEIVIRESHKNGAMVQERMMEVIGVVFSGFGKNLETSYVCEDAENGHRQAYTASMLVGDPDFDQEKGEYPVTAVGTMDTNANYN